MTDSRTHLYSPGLVGVIATESSVSNINGEKGILSYRGYSIEELAQKSTFEETSYLLLFGELPKTDQLKHFASEITKHRELPADLVTILKALPKETRPMDVLQMAVSSLGTFYDLEVNPEKVKGIRQRVCFEFDSGNIKTITLRNQIAEVSSEMTNCDILVKTSEQILKEALAGVRNPVMTVASGDLDTDGQRTNFLNFLSKFSE